MKFIVCIVSSLFIFKFGVVGSSCLCPRPWITFRDHCYQFIRKQTSFDHAEEICESYSDMNGHSHLVSIHDEEELLFVSSNSIDIIGTGHVWIGLNDIQEEGEYVWTDGSTFNYSKFSEGEPNDDGNEDCIHITDDGRFWNDHYCHLNKYFLCKRVPWQWANNCYL